MNTITDSGDAKRSLRNYKDSVQRPGKQRKNRHLKFCLPINKMILEKGIEVLVTGKGKVLVNLKLLRAWHSV